MLMANMIKISFESYHFKHQELPCVAFDPVCTELKKDVKA